MDRQVPKNVAHAVKNGLLLLIQDVTHKVGFYVLLVVLALSVLAGGWWWATSKYDNFREKYSWCVTSSEKDCGRWAHPGQWGWFGGGKEDKGPQQSTPASQTATAPQSTPVEEPEVAVRECQSRIPGVCWWKGRGSSADE